MPVVPAICEANGLQRLAVCGENGVSFILTKHLRLQEAAKTRMYYTIHYGIVKRKIPECFLSKRQRCPPKPSLTTNDSFIDKGIHILKLPVESFLSDRTLCFSYLLENLPITLQLHSP
ncbi:hypothetical protein NPIL_258941 [Nephila pilipes]|uniref:Uncharacterized protein n=1 Tax=Nephila pilipes TaxID=299642 RepID=A0A8X6QGG8_NEPPI|nr:hypothetical protein NPIL_258941 [Nephila pilipes]